MTGKKSWRSKIDLVEVKVVEREMVEALGTLAVSVSLLGLEPTLLIPRPGLAKSGAQFLFLLP